MMERLVKVRAWLTCHNDLLRDSSRWPVPHTVEQLAVQAPDGTFELPHGTGMPAPHLIELITKPATQQCLMKLKAERPVTSIAISPDGSILAHAVSPAHFGPLTVL